VGINENAEDFDYRDYEEEVFNIIEASLSNEKEMKRFINSLY
jgi:hypothetical protein